MRKLKFIAALLIVSVNVVMTFGQEKVIEQKDFQEMTERSEKRLEGLTYRSTKISETLVEGNAAVKKGSTRITENVPPNRYHWIYELDNVKEEVIEIGTNKFYKEENTSWKLGVPPFATGNSGCTGDTESETYRVTENSPLNETPVNLYEKIEKLRNVCGNKNDNEIVTSRYWISGDGFLLKKEFDTAVSDTHYRDTTIFEYKLKIRIEAPKKFEKIG